MGSSFIIAASWRDNPVSQQFRALGAELVARGHRVVLLIDQLNRSVENPTANPAVLTWPSERPTRLQDAWFLSGLIRQHRPDCLVSNGSAVNLMALVGWSHRVKHRVGWYHTLSSQIDADTSHPSWKLALLRWRKRHVWRFATAIAAVSQAARQDLQARFRVPDGKCRVIYNSLKDPLGSKTIKRTLSGENRLLCVGRLHPSKGQDVLLRALARLKPELRRMSVEFLGAGPLRTEYERLAAELGLTGCCRFTGSVSHERVLEAMAHADVTVVPSRNEAFGLTALESLAVETPVVASAVGGLPEILGEDLERLLVPPANPEALANALKRVLADAAGYPQLSSRARARFVQHFELGAAVKRQADWLENLVA